MLYSTIEKETGQANNSGFIWEEHVTVLPPWLAAETFGDGYVETEERDTLLNNESQSSDDETIEPTREDVVVSLLNHEYKRHLEPEIKRIARMKASNKAVDTKERAVELMKGFMEKVLRGNGRFLRSDRSGKIYEEISEKDAVTKIRQDLSREASKHSKRNLSQADQSVTKKHKTNSEDDNAGVRPKRGIQLVKQNKNMRYIEEVNVGSVDLGYHVTGYNLNSSFNLKRVEDKHECVGQAFAKQLMTKPEWNVKLCYFEDNKSAFVTYKDCNKCNSNELNAVEGETKFTGYRRLADYVYSTGLVNKLIREKELKDIFHEFELSCSVEEPKSAVLTTGRASEGGAAAVPQKHLATMRLAQRESITRANVLTTETTIHHASISPFIAYESSTSQHSLTATPEEGRGGGVAAAAVPQREPTVAETRQNQARTNVLPTNTPNHQASVSPFLAHEPSATQHPSTASNPSDMIEKRHALRAGNRKVKEKLAHYRATYISNDDQWKRDTGVLFYRMLSKWLLLQAENTMSIRKFDCTELNKRMDEFEMFMDDLLASEKSDEEDDAKLFHMKMIESCVKELKDKFQ